MLGFYGLVVLVVLSSAGVFGGRLNDEYSVGTNLNKYLWSKEGEDEVAKRDGDKRTNDVLWFGPRIGKRSQTFSNENLPIEIIEILQKIQKSPELQSLLAEKLQLEGLMPYVVYLSNSKPETAHLMSPRYLRDSPDGSTNLNSRPYPPRFGRTTGGLPPYLPRLGRSMGDAE